MRRTRLERNAPAIEPILRPVAQPLVSHVADIGWLSSELETPRPTVDNSLPRDKATLLAILVDRQAGAIPLGEPRPPINKAFRVPIIPRLPAAVLTPVVTSLIGLRAGRR